MISVQYFLQRGTEAAHLRINSYIIDIPVISFSGRGGWSERYKPCGQNWKKRGKEKKKISSPFNLKRHHMKSRSQRFVIFRPGWLSGHLMSV